MMVFIQGFQGLALFLFSHLILLMQWRSAADAYNILLIPQLGDSHVAALTLLGLELSSRGHKVHLLLGAGHYPLPVVLKSPTNLSRTIVIERYGESELEQDSNGSSDDSSLPHQVVSIFNERLEAATLKMLEDETGNYELFLATLDLIKNNSEQLLGDNEKLILHLEAIKFDVAIVDSGLLMKYLYLIPHRLGIPWITYTNYLEHSLARVPWLPSFVPSRLSAEYSDRMSFLDRLRNTAFDLLMTVIYSPSLTTSEQVSKYQKYRYFSSLNDLVRNSELFITTYDVVLDYAKPTMPNIIHAGGMTTRQSNSSSLPNHIQTFISAAKHGIILVTFGSTAARLPAKTVHRFVEAFKRLGGDYGVIWRLINKDSVMMPPGVMISDWVPQSDILGSGRVKLFITHCGNDGQFESVYHAVPMIGFPLKGDQHYNAHRMVHKGYGLALNIHNFSSDDLFRSMKKVLSDKKYSKRLRKASYIYRASPESALERAARAVEQVIKYGVDHLKSGGNDLWLYEYWMLDILTVFGIVLLFVISMGFVVIRRVLIVVLKILHAGFCLMIVVYYCRPCSSSANATRGKKALCAVKH